LLTGTVKEILQNLAMSLIDAAVSYGILASHETK
jgi:hypothetical protein